MDKVNIVNVSITSEEVLANGSIFIVSHIKLHSSQNLPELFRTHLIATQLVPVLKELLNREASSVGEVGKPAEDLLGQFKLIRTHLVSGDQSQ